MNEICKRKKIIGKKHMIDGSTLAKETTIQSTIDIFSGSAIVKILNNLKAKLR